MNKVLMFLVSFVLVTGALLLGVKFAQAHTNGVWGPWVNTSACIANQCGTSEGKVSQSRTCVDGEGRSECSLAREVCDEGCPKNLTFTATRGGVCPDGYTEVHSGPHDGQCEKQVDDYALRYADKVGNPKHCPDNDGSYNKMSGECSRSVKVGSHTEYVNKSTTETFTKTFDYDKWDQDPHKCHRPTGDSLGVPAWAMNEFNRQFDEFKDTSVIGGSCHQEPADTQSQTIDCTDAKNIPCTGGEDTTIVTPTCASDEHLSLEGTKCLKWELGGAPAPVGGAQVLGTSTTGGQVLGTNTMAKTGMAEEAIFNLIFSLGMGLTGFGIRKVSKSSVK